MGAHYAYEKGDRVNWPLTQMPAQDGQRYLTVEDTIVTRYKSGNYYIRYLFTELMQRIIEDMHCNVEEAFDNLCVISGVEGVGKSSMGYYVCKSFDPQFDLEKSLIYSWPQFIDSIANDTQRVYWLDEAVLVASNRDWMKDANKLLIKALQLIRSYRLTIVMCIPSFNAIDVYIRTFRTRYYFKVQRMKWTRDNQAVRGYAELFIPKSEVERAALKGDAQAEDYFKSVGFLRFPKMDAEAAATYDALKLKNQQATFSEMHAMTEEMSSGSRYKRDKKSLTALVSYLADVQGLSYQEIADLAGMPYSTVKNMAWRKRNENEGDFE